jgi:EpsI family protein
VSAMLTDPSDPGAGLPLLLRRALAAALLMLLFAAAAWVMTPTRKLVDLRGKPDFEALLPPQFGDWREEKMGYAQIINPQQEVMLHRIYTQTLSRTYVDSRGRRVMLALAYGEDQRDGMQLHYPEVCYPAQGFMLQSQQPGTLQLAGRSIRVKRLSTQMGTQRRESVTYWTLLGDTVFQGGTAKKLAELRYGMQGQIADGLLFRISSIEADPQDGFALQEAFSRELMAALTPPAQQRLIGKSDN